jgi:hypothetical protein
VRSVASEVGRPLRERIPQKSDEKERVISQVDYSMVKMRTGNSQTYPTIPFI